jgi:multicomponent Na+:H+ antiporter subunit G
MWRGVALLSLINETIISILLILSAGLSVLGALGLVRFPDAYNRIHASGKSTTLGTTFAVIAGTIYFSVTDGLNLKLLLVIPFLFWTASAGAFMIGRAAHRTGPHLAPGTVRDDLAYEAGTVKEQE